MIRNHLRSNVVGYLALFVALSGTAVALPATNTVFSDDIVNGRGDLEGHLGRQRRALG